MTNFYQLTDPEYEDDFESERLNPVWTESSYEIPGFICPNCGHMGFGHHLRIPLPAENALEEFKGTRHVPLDEWRQERPRWAKLLGVALDRVTPCASIGPPEGLLKGMPSADIIHPSADIWVRTRVMDKLKGIRCTGVEFAKAQFIYRPTDPESFCDGVHVDYDPIDLDNLPEYWELTVTGTASREGQDENTITVCDLCGRKKFAPLKNVKIDESRWDGSDFFNIETRHSFVIVTKRVCNALMELGASNYVCKPLP